MDDRSTGGVLAGLVRRWTGPIFFSLALFEMVIRAFVYSPRPQVPDPLLGQVPTPGSTWVNGKEGLGRIHWSREGIRGRDLPAAGEVKRVVVMGDSFCLAEGVSDQQTFCAGLERELSRRLGRDVWVGNCGRSSLDAADYMYLLPAYERKFHPDLILIAFSLSDFRIVDHHLLPGIMAQFDCDAPSAQALTCLSSGGTRGQHAVDATVRGTLGRFGHAFVDQSSLALYGGARLYAKLRKATHEARINRDDQIATAGQMERYLAALAALSKTPIACVYLRPWNLVLPATKPAAPATTARPGMDDAPPSMRGSLNNHFDLVTAARLQEAAGRLGIPFLDTGPAMRRQFERTGQPGAGFPNTFDGPGFGHLNPAGHAVVARATAPLLARLLTDGSGFHRLRVAQAWAKAAGVSAPAGVRVGASSAAALSGARRLASGLSR